MKVASALLVVVLFSALGAMVGAILNHVLLGACIGALIPAIWLAVVFMFFAMMGVSITKFFSQ